ncbi:MAG: hypothetical protein AAF806_11360 [Bacteroidota bacterium]
MQLFSYLAACSLLFLSSCDGELQELPDTFLTFKLTVENGYGSGTYKVGDTVHIFAREEAQFELFDNWTFSVADIQFLADEGEWRNQFIMPASDLTCTANFASLDPDFLQFEEIQAAEHKKPVYYAFPENHKGTVFVFHGTGGSTRGWITPNKDQSYALVKDLYHAGFGVVITESEESTLRRDLNGDGKLRWQGYPIDPVRNIDYRNMEIIIRTFEDRGVLNRNNIHTIGMSNGGSFSGTFSFFFDAKTSVIYQAGSQQFIAKNTNAATLFCMMPNDDIIQTDGNEDALAHHNILKTRGIRSEYFMNVPYPVYSAYFQRVGIDAVISEAIFEELKTNQVIDNQNFLQFSLEELQEQIQRNPSSWSVLSGLSTRNLIDAVGLLDVAYGGHQFYSNHNKRTINFLGAGD